jgi:hypothetical protein
MRNLQLLASLQAEVSSNEVPGLKPSGVTWDSSSDTVYAILGPSDDFPTVELKKLNVSNALISHLD